MLNKMKNNIKDKESAVRGFYSCLYNVDPVYFSENDEEVIKCCMNLIDQLEKVNRDEVCDFYSRKYDLRFDDGTIAESLGIEGSYVVSKILGLNGDTELWDFCVSLCE